MNRPVSRPASIGGFVSLVAGIIGSACNWAVAGEAIAVDQLPDDVKIFVASGTWFILWKRPI